jgi:hypothetical protein
MPVSPNGEHARNAGRGATLALGGRGRPARAYRRWS